jgi:hypothetical protein
VLTRCLQTAYADNITFLRWIVDNGDDSISMKQNSTNIYIANCTFHTGLSFAMGSIGQYPGQINVIENVTAENIILHNTIYGARVKTVRKSRSLLSRLYTDQYRSGPASIRDTHQMAEVSSGLTYQGTNVQYTQLTRYRRWLRLRPKHHVP